MFPTHTMLAAAGLLLISPPLIAVHAVIHANRLTSTGSYTLLRLTPLTDHDLLWMLVKGSLRRVWLLLVLTALAILTLALGMSHLSSAWTMSPYPFFSPFSLRYRLPGSPTMLIVWRIDRLGWTPEFYGWLIGLGGVLILAAVIGVRLALHGRPPALAAALTTSTAQLVMLSGLLMISLLPLERLPVLCRALTTLTVVALPYLLAWLSFRIRAMLECDCPTILSCRHKSS